MAENHKVLRALAKSVEQMSADMSLLSESVALAVAWCKEAEESGQIPTNFMEGLHRDQEFQRLRTECRVLKNCLQHLNGADNIDALKLVLGTRIEAITDRMESLEAHDGTESIGNTGTG